MPLSPNSSHNACIRGCEAAEEQFLELIPNLSHCFDGHYPAELLAFVRREFNPRTTVGRPGN